MIKKSNKIAITLLACGLLVGPMVLSQSQVFAEEIDTELLAIDNTVNPSNDYGLSPKIKSSRNIYSDNKANSDFRYIKGDGSDLRILSADAQNRSSSVLIIFKTNGKWYIGSGTFVGNKTILTAAHVGYDTAEKNPTGTKNGLEELYYVIDSNGPLKRNAIGNLIPSTGVMYKVPSANLKAFNESRLLKNGKIDKDWDIAIIHTEEAFPVSAEKHGMKFTDISKLATQDAINNLKQDEPLTIHAYPGLRNVGAKNAGNLKESIEVGKQYTLRTSALREFVQEGSDNHVHLHWNGSTVGGMSGSGVRNINGDVIGILAYATNETEDKGESNGFGGGLILTPGLYNWVKSEIASTNQKGWVTVNNNKFYLDETTGNFIKSATRAIDGHNWKFDAKGVASDLGAAEAPKSSETPKPSEASKPSETPKPSEASKPSETPKPSEAPKPSETPKPSEMPKPSETKPSETPKPSETKPSETPKPSETKPSETPKPSETKPSDKPKPSETKPSDKPKPSETKPSDKPKPSETKPSEVPKPSETPKSSDKNDEAKPSETPKPSDKKDEAKPSKTPKPSDKKDDTKPSETLKASDKKDDTKPSNKKDELKPSENKSPDKSDKKIDTKTSEGVKPELTDKSKANENTPELNDSSKPSDKSETGDSKPELADKSKVSDNVDNLEVNKSLPELKSDKKSDVKPDGQSSSLDNKSDKSSVSQSGQDSTKQDLPKTNDVKIPLTVSGIILATAGFVALGYRKFFGKN